MKSIFSLLVLIMISLSSVLGQFSPSPTVNNAIYVNSQNRLGILNPADGTVSVIGTLEDYQTSMPIPRIGSLAINSSGELYGFGHIWNSSTAPNLYRIDPATAQVEFIGSYTPPAVGYGFKGAAFDDNDNLVAVDWTVSGQDLYTIDVNTGAETLLFDDVLSPSWYGGLERNPSNGLLYASSWSGIVGIVSIDPVTGTVNNVLTSDPTPALEADLFFDASGDLYVIGNRGQAGSVLHLIDEINNTSTFVADLPFGINSAVLAPDLSSGPVAGVPTMSEWGLLILGLMLLIVSVVALKSRLIAPKVS